MVGQPPAMTAGSLQAMPPVGYLRDSATAPGNLGDLAPVGGGKSHGNVPNKLEVSPSKNWIWMIGLIWFHMDLWIYKCIKYVFFNELTRQNQDDQTLELLQPMVDLP